MFDLSKVTTDVPKQPISVVTHGPGGVGKTTALAHACVKHNGIMLCVGEDGLSPLKIEGVPHNAEVITKFEDFKDALKSLIISKHDYKLVGIDNIDGIVPGLDEYIVRTSYDGDEKKANAYKAKYAQYAAEFDRILKAFDVLKSKGINVIINCHSTRANSKDPSTESYKRWEFNLPNGDRTSMVDSLFNWANVVLFANHDVVVDEKSRGAGGQPVVYTQWTPAYDAKMRVKGTVPEKITFNYDEIFKFIN